jgi:hypothetical protein
VERRQSRGRSGLGEFCRVIKVMARVVQVYEGMLLCFRLDVEWTRGLPRSVGKSDSLAHLTLAANFSAGETRSRGSSCSSWIEAESEVELVVDLDPEAAELESYSELTGVRGVEVDACRADAWDRNL